MWPLVRYFLALGTTGFGGPIALVGYMQRDLVERRRWFSDREYLEGLAFCQLAPGPLAAQLAIYLGWRRGGIPGATLAGLAFVLPSFAMVLMLSVLYLKYGGLDWLQRAFYGIAAAVIAIVARSAVKLCRMSLNGDRLLGLIFGINAVVVVLARSELLSVFLASGMAVMVLRGRLFRFPSALPGVVIAAAGFSPVIRTGGDSVHWDLLAFFIKAGAVVFGSGLAIVPFLYGGAVEQYGWLTERQFLDAVAVSMITPGPVVITVAFVGYLVEGFPGAALAAAGVFLPVYLAVVLGAPWFNRFANDSRIVAFVSGVTAAATGAIAGAAVILAQRALPDLGAVLVAAMALLLSLRFRRLPDPVLIAAAGCLGVILS